MKREQIINKIYDKIRDDLLHAKLLYLEEDDTNKYPLVDHLSSGDDISTGRDEIDNLIEQIEIEDLIDAILALHESMMKTTVRKCASCDAPLNDYCERCQHQLES